MSRCLYNSKRIIPAPFVQIQKQYVRVGQEKVGTTFTLTLNGTIVAYKGSPASTNGPIGGDSAGDWNGRFFIGAGTTYPSDESVASIDRLSSIFRKQEAIRELFSTDGQLLEFQSAANTPLKCRPRINGITFEEGIWTDVYKYTIELECETIDGLNVQEDVFTDKVSDANESWEIQYDEESQTYNMSHTISAVGKLTFGTDGLPVKKAWEQARDFCRARMGYDATMAAASGSLSLNLTNYNHIRQNNVDELGGSFSFTESWVLSPTNYIEDFTVNTNNESQNGVSSITIEGSVRGLDTRDISYNLTESRWAAASGAFFGTILPQMYTRANAYHAALTANKPLNITPLANTVGINPKAGNITYSYSYDTRPSNCVSGALSEVINVVDNNPGQIVAQIPVLGRVHGPVLQDIGTYTARTRSLTIELIMPVTGTSCSPLSGKPSSTAIDAIINSVTPIGNQVYKTADQTTWEFKSGRFSQQVEWTWEE